MKKDLLDILACPTCKGELELKVDEENESEVVRGSLTCKKCGETYPIVDSIPDLRPPNLRDGGEFDDFEDLDDFDDDEERPILPIAIGLLVIALLVMVGIIVRGKSKNA